MPRHVQDRVMSNQSHSAIAQHIFARHFGFQITIAGKMIITIWFWTGIASIQFKIRITQFNSEREFFLLTVFHRFNAS